MSRLYTKKKCENETVTTSVKINLTLQKHELPSNSENITELHMPTPKNPEKLITSTANSESFFPDHFLEDFMDDAFILTPDIEKSPEKKDDRSS